MTRAELIATIPEAGWRQATPSPDCAALLVMDMQEYFRGLALEILPNLTNVISACRQFNVPVIYTQHGHEDPQVDGGMLAQWWGELIMRGTHEWSLMSEIAPKPHEIVISKKRYSAFFDTDLEKHLRRQGAREVIVSGVMTNLCCETTAREAFVRDYRVFFLADGTASNDQVYHHGALRNLAVGFAYLVTCEEVTRSLRTRERL